MRVDVGAAVELERREELALRTFAETSPFSVPQILDEFAVMLSRPIDEHLIHMRARFYDPHVGRFLASDPITEHED